MHDTRDSPRLTICLFLVSLLTACSPSQYLMRKALEQQRDDLVTPDSTGSVLTKLASFCLDLPTGTVPNLIRLLASPSCLQPHVENWDEVASALRHRLRRESIVDSPDPAAGDRLEDLLRPPAGGPPDAWDLTRPPPILIPIRLRRDGATLSFFSTVTTLGTPQDITLQELRIETLFPADASTEEALTS